MQSILATFLCTAAICYFNKIFSQSEKKVFWTSWIPTIWVLIILSRPISLWLSKEGYITYQNTYVEGSPIDRNIYIILITISLLLLIKRKVALFRIIKSNIAICVLFIYFGISIIWTDFPFIAFKRWIKSLGNLIIILVILTDSNPLGSLKVIMLRCAFILLPLSILLIKYYPEYGVAYTGWHSNNISYVGVAEDKNSLGSLCLITGLFIFSEFQRKRNDENSNSERKFKIFYLILLSMVFWLLIKCNSATSLICLCIGIFIIIIFDYNVVRDKIGFFVYLSFFISILFLPILTLYFKTALSSFLSITGHEQTFWGRTVLWNDLLEMINNPLFGTGYMSFWIGDRLLEIWSRPNYWWHPNQSHNGYLEVYINLGIVGLFLLLCLIVSSIKQILKEINHSLEYSKLRISYVIIALIFNITEAAFSGLHPVWFFFILFSLNISNVVSEEKNITYDQRNMA
jgi:O-antigen ligase